MNSDNLKNSWNQFKTLNNSPEISNDEILSIIETSGGRPFHFLSERVLRNAAIFSFLIAFCQNCYP